MEKNSGLFDQLFCTPAMTEVFSNRRRLQGMLDFEAALARAEADAGVIPVSAAPSIARCCVATEFDIEALAQATALAGNAAIPLVKSLTQRVAAVDASAAQWVHWGATSQDTIDTGLMLQVRAAIALLMVDITRLEYALTRLAQDHAGTLMAGRTWLQHALPVTFGLKAAGWLSALQHAHERLKTAAHYGLALQFGGAAGTLASLGDKGLTVSTKLAKELNLPLPDLPWHANRGRFTDLACALGLLCGVLGKTARDISLLMQSEIGEAFEPAATGKGGSSTMPQKRNPVGCAVALSAAIRAPQLVATMLAAMPQEHERGLGGWHAEWETLPTLFMLTAGALAQITGAVSGIEIDTERMKENLVSSNGLILAEAVSMALAVAVGKEKAHALVEAASKRALKQNRSLREIVTEDAAITAHLSGDALAQIFETRNYLGMNDMFIARVLKEKK